MGDRDTELGSEDDSTMESVLVLRALSVDKGEEIKVEETTLDNLDVSFLGAP